MSIAEKLGRAAAELGNAADEAVKAAKSKYEETVTPEKRAEMQEKFDKGMAKAEKLADAAAEKIEQGIKGFTDGFNSVNHTDKK